MPAAAPAGPPAPLGFRLRACIPEKVAVLLGLSIGICVPYFGLQHLGARPLHEVWVTPLDHWIGFAPASIWSYASLDDLARIFSWQETRFVSKSLTLHYKRVLYVLDPTDAARAARGKRVLLEEREDGSLCFWHGEHALLATAFPKEHSVHAAEVVESKRLAETMEFIKERQRERTEAKLAKPFTTLRKARLLRAGTPRRTATGASSETRP